MGKCFHARATRNPQAKRSAPRRESPTLREPPQVRTQCHMPAHECRCCGGRDHGGQTPEASRSAAPSAACFSVRVSCRTGSRVPSLEASAGQMRVRPRRRQPPRPWEGSVRESTFDTADAGRTGRDEARQQSGRPEAPRPARIRDQIHWKSVVKEVEGLPEVGGPSSRSARGTGCVLRGRRCATARISHEVKVRHG